ncbi:MAG: hypothetical protein ABIN48_04870, partial [Ginsengibacter sp.]
MKKFLFFLPILFLITLSSYSTDYFIASNGNDNNNGTSQSSPWRTIDKLNSFSSNMQAGDRIFFRRGDTFYGGIKDPMKGRQGSPLTYGAYGSGQKPLITGFASVSNWVNKGGNIWESVDPVSSLPNLNLVLINGVNTPMGRYPNGDASYPFLPNFYMFQNHTGNGPGPSSISSNNLNGGTN